MGLLLFGLGCSGGGGGGSSGAGAGTTSFQVTSLSVPDGSVWQINREIVLSFTEPVDFTTVSANTINIRSLSDVPATGTFSLRDPNTVVFQPNCPTRMDLSDAGLLPNGVTYVLRVAGLNTSSNTLRSRAGVPLGLQQIRTFTTPASTQLSVAFQDTTPGPPAPVLRSQGSAQLSATYLEVGGDPDARVYFELDPSQQLVLSEPQFEVPLNLYSDRSTQIAVLLAFNQPVNPEAGNISESRLRLEFQDSLGNWLPIQTRLALLANCAGTGAQVRMEPVGVLPAASAFRAVVRAGFQDLVGESVQQSLTGFAHAPTRTVDFSSLVPSDLLGDEVNEGFDFSGPSPLSFEDEGALFDSPVAEWGEGRLSAAFSFEGSGGPSGTFDWVVRAGERVFFDTSSTPIVGGPDGVPTTAVTFVNGVVDVRNFIIQAGGEVRVQGPNPMRINATGDVRIDGLLDLSGFSAKDVATLNTGNQIEIGGAGAAAGGKGGNASESTGGPTTRGGRGSGPFRQLALGGDGGEMGVSNAPGTNGKDQRRPGGGGGGRFAKDAIGTVTPSDVSVVAVAGSNGHPSSIGAETNTRPARGGIPGSGPFLDASNANDFLGTRPVVSGGQLVSLVRGELPSVWGGYGGGGGGNAARFYPNPNWNIGSDEKGGGGGGAAGGLHIKALGRIVFGAAGKILANGGFGATGENTNFLDHIGGTGGGGSGGHVILESATLVDFTADGVTVGENSRDMIQAAGPPKKTGPIGYVNGCREQCCDCVSYSNGGAGGPGVIQIHVPDAISPPSDDPSSTDIVVPTHALNLANALDAVSSPPAYAMIPTFGARSKARSDWISIGGADQKPGGGTGLVRFLFEGIETSGADAGKILTQGSTVLDVEPLLSVANLATSQSARILPDGFTMEITGDGLLGIRSGTTSGVSNDVYLRTPALLEDCTVRLSVVQTPTNFEDFDIAHAEYDEGGPGSGDEALRVTVTTERGPLTDFNPGGSGTIALRLMPRFFQVVTNGLPRFLPETAYVRVQFQAAADNGIGAPDEQNPLVDWTSDITQFNALPAGALQFFRYEVEFDLDAAAQGVTADTEPVTLDFLKIPFVF
jgi:hypothetical protein